MQYINWWSVFFVECLQPHKLRMAILFLQGISYQQLATLCSRCGEIGRSEIIERIFESSMPMSRVNRFNATGPIIFGSI